MMKMNRINSLYIYNYMKETLRIDFSVYFLGLNYELNQIYIKVRWCFLLIQNPDEMK